MLWMVVILINNNKNKVYQKHLTLLNREDIENARKIRKNNKAIQDMQKYMKNE